jgi:serine/threonine-protein kinase HipA
MSEVVFKRMSVETTQGHAGELRRESQFVFNYRSNEPCCEIALSMPLRARSYAANILPGVLRQNLPEGYLYFWIKQHFGKVARMDDMNILAIAGRDVIGRVRCEPLDVAREPLAPGGEDLAGILAWKGSEDLFSHLVHRYALSSGVSGVQPKVLVPEKISAPNGEDVIDKSTMKARSLIVKSAGDDYPGLAENEYLCMSIARAAGLETPDFWLSDDKKLFVVQRFDFTAGKYLGFEDMTSLMDKQNDDKYAGSYESVAKAVTLFCTPAFVLSSLHALFRAVVLNVILRNGDAHLKNFGLLYTHPHSDDCRLSPLYDVVNTTMYIPQDTLALKLGKSKAWPGRDALLRFGREHCRIDRPDDLVDEIAEAVTAYRPAESSPVWARMKDEIARASSALM